MADTWAGNASNQLFTLKALRNACSLGIFGYTTLPADTREICTVADLNTYGIKYYSFLGDSTNAYPTFSGISDQLCLDTESMTMVLYIKNNLMANTCEYNTGTYETLYVSGDGYLGVGKQLYTNRARTTTKTYTTAGWIFDGSISWYVSTAGAITSSYAC